MENPKIIYEDKNVLVINKPAGLLVHPIKISNLKSQISKVEETLVDWLIKKYPDIQNVGDPSPPAGGSGQKNLRPGIVHRLDKDTSGVMIVAKNQTSFEYLKSEFKNRKIKKTYMALVAGKINLMKGKIGVINLPIGRSRSNPTKRLASLKARGTLREAITEYKILESFDIGCQKSPTSDVRNGNYFTLVEAYPKTGRTHQVRVHFKAIGHPIACDKLYGSNRRQPAEQTCPAGLSRHFLHASSLELTLPDNSHVRLEADLPDDLEKVLEKLRGEK